MKVNADQQFESLKGSVGRRRDETAVKLWANWADFVQKSDRFKNIDSKNMVRGSKESFLYSLRENSGKSKKEKN